MTLPDASSSGAGGSGAGGSGYGSGAGGSGAGGSDQVSLALILENVPFLATHLPDWDTFALLRIFLSYRFWPWLYGAGILKKSMGAIGTE